MRKDGYTLFVKKQNKAKKNNKNNKKNNKTQMKIYQIINNNS